MKLLRGAASLLGQARPPPPVPLSWSRGQIVKLSSLIQASLRSFPPLRVFLVSGNSSWTLLPFIIVSRAATLHGYTTPRTYPHITRLRTLRTVQEMTLAV